MHTRLASSDVAGSSVFNQSFKIAVGGHGGASRAARSLAAIIPLLVTVEYVFVCTAAYLGSLTYHSLASSTWAPSEQYGGAAVFIAGLTTMVSVGLRQFANIQSQPRHRFLWSGIGAAALAFALLVSALFFLKIGENYSRGALIFQLGFVSMTIVAIRAAAHSGLHTAIARGLVASGRVILAGQQEHCVAFISRLHAPGLRIVSVLPLADREAKESDWTGDSDSQNAAILASCRAARPDDIVVVCNDRNLEAARRLALELSELPAGIHIFDVSTTAPFAAAQLAAFGNMVTLQVSHAPLSVLDRAIKRAFDVLLALGGLVVLSPLLVLVAVVVALDAPGPILFRQTRHGYNNEAIRILKFRTMKIVEDGDSFTQAVKGDERVTRVGRLLRRTSIDELPQLLNVLLGEMSIVGPRPHATAHNRAFESRISGLSRRHRVKPGITGWAQVNGFRGPTDTLEKMQRRIEHDLFYIENWSVLLDLKIIIMTLFSKRSYTNAC